METTEYTVVAGDTLGGISQKLYGHSKWECLYGMNRKEIEAEQIRRDPKRIGPNWIYPGMVLMVPAVANTPSAHEPAAKS